MNFTEAMQQLREGAKVSRRKWTDPTIFKLVDGKVKCFENISQYYVYDESIFLSEGWRILGLEIEGKEVELCFCDLIPHLKSGAKARLSSWEDSYICIDNESKFIVFKSIVECNFREDLESLVAEDWMVIE